MKENNRNPISGFLDRLTDIRGDITTGTEASLRNDIYNFAQKQHLAACLFSLDEIVIEPRVLTPLIQAPRSMELAPTDSVSLSIPYIPDWPELAASYRASTMTLLEALQGSGNVILAGHPGSGKTVALAWLAACMARNDKGLGKLSGLLPLYAHATDLRLRSELASAPLNNADNEQEGLSGLPSKQHHLKIKSGSEAIELLIQAISRYSSTETQARLPKIVHTALDSQRAFLILDRVDELAPKHARLVGEYLGLVQQKYPKLRIIIPLSYADMAGLPARGYAVLAMAAWDEVERDKLLQRWSEQWVKFISPTEKGSAKKINPHFLKGWLGADNTVFNPLEYTLKVWAAFSGDILGPDGQSAIEAYIRRMTSQVNGARPGLERFALQLLVEMDFASNPRNIGHLVAAYKASHQATIEIKPPEIVSPPKQSEIESLPKPLEAEIPKKPSEVENPPKPLEAEIPPKPVEGDNALKPSEAENPPISSTADTPPKPAEGDNALKPLEAENPPISSTVDATSKPANAEVLPKPTETENPSKPAAAEVPPKPAESDNLPKPSESANPPKPASIKIPHFKDLPGVDSLTSNGFLISYPDSHVGFCHPIISGYLAGKALSEIDMISQVQGQPAWMGKNLAQFYFARYGDVTPQIQNYLQDDDILHTNHLVVSRWLQVAPKNRPWRTIILRTLASVLLKERDSLNLAAKIVTAMAFSGDEGVAIYFRQLLKSEHPNIKQLASLGCGILRDKKAIADLSQMLGGDSPALIRSACLALAAIADNQSLELLASSLLNGSELLRRCAAEALANNAKEGHPALQDGAAMEEVLVRRSVIYGLIRIDQPWAIKIVENLQLDDKEWVVRNAAIQVFDELHRKVKLAPQPLPDLIETAWLVEYANKISTTIAPGKPAEELVTKALANGDPDQKLNAMDYFRQKCDPRTVDLIYKTYKNSTGELHDAAYYVLWLMTIAGIKLPFAFE